MLNKIIRNVDIVATICCFSYLLCCAQSRKNAEVITISMVFFTMMYGFLNHIHLPFLNPQNMKLKPHVDAEWQSRIVGSVHAILLTIGSVFCFLEWPYYPENDAWTVNNENVYYYPELFASIFAGYLQYDFLWLVWNKKENFDLGAMIHHVLYISITHYVLWGRYFARPFAWLSFGELSTPFLHLRWFLAVSDNKNCSWYSVASKLFAFTFLLTRVVCYGLGLLDIWMAKEVWEKLPSGVHGVIAGVHLGYVLNLFWATKVISALMKSLTKKNKSS